ncbi:MAG TPA: hypothetical protein PLW44_04040 [Chitinophagales bacterium]|nr:hypothetical protein [Chitinophagales bacterium]
MKFTILTITAIFVLYGLNSCKRGGDKSSTRLFATPCSYNSGTNTWDVSGANELAIRIVQESTDPSPMIKIKYNGVDVQCIPASTIRKWWVKKVSGVYYFVDSPADSGISICNSVPTVCLRYTGHESNLKIKFDNALGPGKYAIIGTDDIRDGTPLSYNTDHVFNVHNEGITPTNNIRVVVRPIIKGSPNYDFVMVHASNLPSSYLPACIPDSMPANVCIRP